MNNHPKEILAGLTRTITKSILNAVGTSSIESIFLAGSVAEDRIAWFDADGHIEIYSDLDLYVIVSPGVDVPAARERARAVIPSLPLATREYTMYREPDIGVFNEKQLLSQPHRPGTVEIALCYQLLYGREEVPDKTRRFEAAEIGREEALYLLENRLNEGLVLRERAGVDPPDGMRRSIYYTRVKQCLDAVTAILIADGVFVCGVDDRMTLFRERSASTGIVLEQQWRDIIEHAYEHMRHLQRSLRHDPDHLAGVSAQAERLLTVVWERIAASLFKKSPSIGWETLLFMRCRGESVVNNLREAVIVSRACERSARTGVSLWSAHPRRQIRTALRLAGVCEALSAAGDDESVLMPRRFIRYLESLTNALGSIEGTVFQRARALYDTVS